MFDDILADPDGVRARCLARTDWAEGYPYKPEAWPGMRAIPALRPDELAAVDGDFIMTAAEVQPVLRALRKTGIHVVALHNHMVGEQPAFYFTHFWGKGKAQDLAESLRAALDVQARAGRNGKGH